MLIILWYTDDTVQAGKPMTVQGEDGSSTLLSFVLIILKNYICQNFIQIQKTITTSPKDKIGKINKE